MYARVKGRNQVIHKPSFSVGLSVSVSNSQAPHSLLVKYASCNALRVILCLLFLLNDLIEICRGGKLVMDKVDNFLDFLLAPKMQPFKESNSLNRILKSIPFPH